MSLRNELRSTYNTDKKLKIDYNVNQHNTACKEHREVCSIIEIRRRKGQAQYCCILLKHLKLVIKTTKLNKEIQIKMKRCIH